MTRVQSSTGANSRVTKGWGWKDGMNSIRRHLTSMNNKCGNLGSRSECYVYFKKCTVKFALFFTFIKMYFIFFTINLNYFAFFVKTGRVPKTVIFTGSMLNISCLKGDSDQTKFRFGINVKNCIGCDSFGKNPRNFIFHRKIYRKSGCCLSKIRKFWANSAHLRTWPRYWCENAVWKIWGLWGHYFWSYRVNGRPDILTDFRVYSFFFEYTKNDLKFRVQPDDHCMLKKNNEEWGFFLDDPSWEWQLAQDAVCVLHRFREPTDQLLDSSPVLSRVPQKSLSSTRRKCHGGEEERIEIAPLRHL